MFVSKIINLFYLFIYFNYGAKLQNGEYEWKMSVKMCEV